MDWILCLIAGALAGSLVSMTGSGAGFLLLPGLRKIIESAQPFSSKMHSRFHRRCTPIFMKVHTQGAVLRTHARVDSGI